MVLQVADLDVDLLILVDPDHRGALEVLRSVHIDPVGDEQVHLAGAYANGPDLLIGVGSAQLPVGVGAPGPDGAVSLQEHPAAEVMCTGIIRVNIIVAGSQSPNGIISLHTVDHLGGQGDIVARRGLGIGVYNVESVVGIVAPGIDLTGLGDGKGPLIAGNDLGDDLLVAGLAGGA